MDFFSIDDADHINLVIPGGIDPNLLAWLNNMDKARNKIMPLMAATYGQEAQTRWWVYWRVFFMACEELWGYKKGEEWIVSHYLFKKRTPMPVNPNCAIRVESIL